MAKFKLGQTVKIISATYEGKPDPDGKRYIGKIGKITSVSENEIGSYPYEVKVMGLDKMNFMGLDLKLIEKGKEPKVNFLLKYDLDEDPIEEFETAQEVKKRIIKLAEEEEESLQEDSIIVYEIKAVYPIILKKEVKIEGF